LVLQARDSASPLSRGARAEGPFRMQRLHLQRSLAVVRRGMASSLPMRTRSATITTITGTGTSPVRSVVYA